MSETFSRVEVITGVARRRRFSTEQKLAVVAETMQPGKSISYVARRHGLSPSLVFRWRRLMSDGGQGNADLEIGDGQAGTARASVEAGMLRVTWRSSAKPRAMTVGAACPFPSLPPISARVGFGVGMPMS
jgi:transposase-like protein